MTNVLPVERRPGGPGPRPAGPPGASRVRGLRAVAGALALAACGPSSPGAAVAPRPAAGSAPPAATAPRYTEADVRFVTEMIGHHAQALWMAGLAPTHGASPAVRTLAARILNGQRDEIVTMQQWLRDHGEPVPVVPAAGEAMAHAGHHAAPMPGMLTPEQMRQLDEATGSDFDRLFLTFMIQHHRGAVTMVQELIGTPGAAQERGVFKLASDVNADQTTEIARMQRMLAALTFGVELS